MNSKKRKKLRIAGKCLFVIYVLFVVYFLLLSDVYGRTGEMQEYHYNLVLFKEIKRFWNYREKIGLFRAATNLLGNVVIFMPFGFFMAMASKSRSIFTVTSYSFGLSLLIEVVQLLTKVGRFDVDDLLLNTAGGILGYVIFVSCNAIRRMWDKNVKR